MKRIAWLLVLVLLVGSVSALGEDEEGRLKSGESWNRVVSVLGRDYLVFAQNSPEWSGIRATNNTEKLQSIGGTACIQFAFANALVNTIPYEMLPRIADILRYPPRVDEYTATAFHGKKASLRFEITENCDFLRYWPLIIVSLAAGNNLDMEDDPDGSFYFGTVTNFYNVKKSMTWEKNEAFAAMDAGALLVTNFYADTTADGVTIGHSFVLVGRDDEYAYMLDSTFKKEFPMPMGKYIEMVEPGLQRIRLANLSKVNLNKFFIIWPKEDFVPYTSERYQEIVGQSNRNWEEKRAQTAAD